MEGAAGNMKDGKFITMAFESSCDETSVAVLEGGRQVLSNVISSQIDIFKAYGGVVPVSYTHLLFQRYIYRNASRGRASGFCLYRA